MLPLAILFAVTAVLDPAPTVTGNCSPTRVHFNGHIRSDAPGSVTYTWLRSNQAAGRTFTLKFEQPGSLPVSYDLLVRKAESGSVMLRVVFPHQVDSAKVKYQATCR